jgi:MFS family permease
VVYPITNKHGRKYTIIGSTAIFCIGVIIQVCPTKSIAAWYVGRIVAGIGMGGQSVVVPMYSAEMTPKEIRGRCGSFYQWLYTWGVFTAYWVDYVIYPSHFVYIRTHLGPYSVTDCAHLPRAWPKTSTSPAPLQSGRSQ